MSPRLRAAADNLQLLFKQAMCQWAHGLGSEVSWQLTANTMEEVLAARWAGAGSGQELFVPWGRLLKF
jgi:hypothetical protein